MALCSPQFLAWSWVTPCPLNTETALPGSQVSHLIETILKQLQLLLGILSHQAQPWCMNPN